mmetsp:Transcript_26277/g.56904  ORF Transcript_26277/g.56904 Transcript_26277/m.56904 type:complete len:173 (-) Transcript_26277:163-681(-)
MEALFVESKKQYAEKERFKDLHAQMRLGALMQKRYPLGVLGMENPSNPETIVYSDTHERWRHEADMHERTLTRMRENHKRHNRDYNFLQTVKPGEKLDEQSARMFPTKRKSDRPPPNSGLVRCHPVEMSRHSASSEDPTGKRRPTARNPLSCVLPDRRVRNICGTWRPMEGS